MGTQHFLQASESIIKIRAKFFNKCTPQRNIFCRSTTVRIVKALAEMIQREKQMSKTLQNSSPSTPKQYVHEKLIDTQEDNLKPRFAKTVSQYVTKRDPYRRVP